MGLFSKKKEALIESAPKSEASINKKPEILNEVVTKHNLIELSRKIKSDKGIDKDDVNNLMNAFVRLINIKNELVGKTLSQILENQNAFEKIQLADRLVQTSSRIEMLINHSFHFLGLEKNDNAEHLNDILVYEITNTSDRNIVSVEGVLEFYNFQNILLKTFGLKLEGNIMPGASSKVGNQFLNDPNNPIDQVIRSNAKINLIWSPKAIRFFDGTGVEEVV